MIKRFYFWFCIGWWRCIIVLKIRVVCIVYGRWLIVGCVWLFILKVGILVIMINNIWWKSVMGFLKLLLRLVMFCIGKFLMIFFILIMFFLFLSEVRIYCCWRFFGMCRLVILICLVICYNGNGCWNLIFSICLSNCMS